MVSVHNSLNYHNHIYNFPSEIFNINSDTIYDYINKNHPDIIEKINNNIKLKNILNKEGIKYTFFISINNTIDNLYDYLFKGEIHINDTDFIIDSINSNRYFIKDNNLNDSTIVVKNIKLKNGILHIIS